VCKSFHYESPNYLRDESPNLLRDKWNEVPKNEERNEMQSRCDRDEVEEQAGQMK